MKRDSKTSVLFLCTANSCRSQMAEGWARHLHADKFRAMSAGVNPQTVNPLAIRVMAEFGVDIRAQASKHVERFRSDPPDHVITVCDAARESCPVFPAHVRTMHRSFDDPPTLAIQAKTEDEALGHYRRVCREIRAFVEELPAILNPGVL